jgi:RNA polymerase sigma-70 factor, ECF subfamily
MTDERRTSTERTNDEWLTDLQATGPAQAQALEDLRQRVRRSIFYYLSRERSDLRGRSYQELERMADDLAQDATLRVMDNLSKFRGEAKFTTWINRIAVRLAISDLRRARHKDFSLEDMTADGDLLPLGNAGDNAPPNPETNIEREDVLAIISKAMEEALTDRQYKAIQAVALRGVPMDLVAEQLGTNRNALYKLLHDARRKLRAHLEAQGLSIDYMMTLFQR